MTQKKTAKPIRGTQGLVQEQVAISGNVPAGTAPIHQVVVIRNRFVYRGLKVLPWFAAAVIISGLITRELPEFYWSDTDVLMYCSAVIAAVLALFIFQILTRRIPFVLDLLWKRNLIGLWDETAPPDMKTAEKTPPSKQQLPDVLEDRYRSFLYQLDGLLNHPAQWLSGGIFALLVLTWVGKAIGSAGSWLRFISRYPFGGIVSSFQLIIEFLLSFWIGLLVWRMIILGFFIWKLGRNFFIRPRIGDPDSCGGLEPLGNLCLWNIILIGLPGIFLGGWLIPSQIWDVGVNDPLRPWVQQSLAFSDLYPKLLLIPVAISIFSFFVPLWSIHLAMLQSRSHVKKGMENFAQSITEIEGKLLDQAETLDQKQADELLKRLKTMQEIYQRNQKYPTWPFNAMGIIKFISVQLLPLFVSLGLSEAIANVVKGILDNS